MKKFKISLLPIATILAMSFTVVNNIDIKKETIRFSLGPEDCFLPSTGTKGKYQCSDPLINVVADDCDEATNKFDIDVAPSPFHLFSLTTTGFIESENILSICNGDSEFCCFTVKEDNNTLTNCKLGPQQPLITIGSVTRRWVINDVFCKP